MQELITDGVAGDEFRGVHAAFAADLAATMTVRIQQGGGCASTGLDDAGAYANPLPSSPTTSVPEGSLFVTPLGQTGQMARSAAHRPTSADLAAAAGKTIPDVLAPDLRVLFCGINPGLWSGATGYHFSRPGNRFWPALFRSGFTPRLFRPDEQEELLTLGLGITNVVPRATAKADELTMQELRDGGRVLVERVQRYRPQILAVLGLGAYRTAFNRPRTTVGRQPDALDNTEIWVLPNPSGLNAHYPPAALAAEFRALREEAEHASRPQES